MNNFAEFVGFFTAHMVWQLEDGENVVSLYVFLAYDGFLTLNDRRSETLNIDAAETTEPDRLSICLAIPYHLAHDESGLAIQPLTVIKARLSDESAFFENF